MWRHKQNTWINLLSRAIRFDFTKVRLKFLFAFVLFYTLTESNRKFSAHEREKLEIGSRDAS